MSNLLVAQSGGPTVAINATLVGVLQGVRASGKIDKVYGAKNGIEGAIKDNLIDLNELIRDTKAMDTLTYTPSSALGSCRYKMKDWRKDDEPYRKIIETFKKYDIKYFIYIGGNDSMDTVDKLSEYCSLNNHDFFIMGAPKTVDNDLNLTDHSPGFGSAAKYIATTIAELERDINVYDIPAVTIVEIMGRNAGWLTAAAALARVNGGTGADLIYLCEKDFDNERFIADVKKKLAEKPGVLVAVSEGVKDSTGAYVSDQMSSGAVDNFGHKYIAGAARALEQMVRNEIGCKCRSIELNLMQRAAAHIASETDIIESLMLGQKALTCALDGQTGKMAAIKRLSDKPYLVEFISVPVNEVANHEKVVPMEWITPDGHDVTEEMMDYLKPLIQGETNLKYENGIPSQIKLY
ncbi:6-phosphofructokinase [Mobilitalea sibirica]|uniref:Pyrophosphate--fructose 6-phosphate 1-phosphotransferase n=1 Tax=Mobilitalea sibirica TaxID=1462919 RepID=A0A8J7H014_9FIRM|nr:6-phosphofructokinase [Mobilitalea sibirica]MBH1941619.1 6-phosphofructokinase [Mobilitalea sibirica]